MIPEIFVFLSNDVDDLRPLCLSHSHAYRDISFTQTSGVIWLQTPEVLHLEIVSGC